MTKFRRAHTEGSRRSGGGYVELGVEQTVKFEVQCPKGVAVEPGVRFDLSEGLKVVAHATVLSVLKTVYEQHYDKPQHLFTQLRTTRIPGSPHAA